MSQVNETMTDAKRPQRDAKTTMKKWKMTTTTKNITSVPIFVICCQENQFLKKKKKTEKRLMRGETG